MTGEREFQVVDTAELKDRLPKSVRLKSSSRNEKLVLYNFTKATGGRARGNQVLVTNEAVLLSRFHSSSPSLSSPRSTEAM